MKKNLLSFFLMVAIVFISYQSFTLSSGPPESYSNAPGEGNCANPGCHGGNEIVSGPLWDSVNLSVVGNTLSGLIADSTYTFELSFANPASVRYGFQLCILPSGANSSTVSLGTLINTSTQTQLVSSPDRTYLEHTSSGTSALSHTKTWSFDWQVPTGYSGDAEIYVVINSTNNDGTNSGDTIIAKSFTANVSLPVSWLSINAERSNADIILKWTTASETETDKFIIERCLDGRSWEVLGNVKAAGHSSVKIDYRYTDLKMMKSAYYRVKQVDFNGAQSYSKMVFASASNWQNAIVFNNETRELTNTNGAIGSIELYNQRGQQVWTTSTTQSAIVVPQLPKGVYFLRSEGKMMKLFL